MDPPSPSKTLMSPGMPVFPASPERVASIRKQFGTPPRYASPTPGSPSLPDLRTSPLRRHRRDDSQVNGLASMFENLMVKDPKEAAAKYVATLDQQKSKYQKDLEDMAQKNSDAVSRLQLRNEELRDQVDNAKAALAQCKTREEWDKKHQEHREAIGKWEKAYHLSEEKRKQAERKAHELHVENKNLSSKSSYYKKKHMELTKENLRSTSCIPTLQTKIQGLERLAGLAEADIKRHSSDAEKYKNLVYGLQVHLEGVEASLGEEVETLTDKLRLVEGERDALKTSLREEEVLRIAAEGQIPLPAATTEEHAAFASPQRSPRRQRSPERERDDDKENVAPKKGAVDLKFVLQELASEKRVRVRAQDQIEFMKMECQFRCCSCRIADLKGTDYVHDGSYGAEMERIKASMPEATPPPSSHGDEVVDLDVVIKEKPLDEDEPMDMGVSVNSGGKEVRSLLPPVEIDSMNFKLRGPTADRGRHSADQSPVISAFPMPPASPAEDAVVAYSPSTGTFRAMPSPAKLSVSVHPPTPMKPVHEDAVTHEMDSQTSLWAPDANSTMVHHEKISPPRFRPASRQEAMLEPRVSRSHGFAVHEDAIESDDDNDAPPTPFSGPSEPATPGPYLTRTITTTTTIPLHFSPVTPATKGVNYTLTPSTVAHAPTDSQSHVMGELSLNAVPFDRAAALEAIRQRRGRARSMAAGQGTPGKQMMEGVGVRRDISAPMPHVGR